MGIGSGCGAVACQVVVAALVVCLGAGVGAAASIGTVEVGVRFGTFRPVSPIAGNRLARLDSAAMFQRHHNACRWSLFALEPQCRLH